MFFTYFRKGEDVEGNYLPVGLCVREGNRPVGRLIMCLLGGKAGR